MLVGTKAIATLSTGYLNALEYAKQRVQGADLTRSADKTAPRVTIIHHPDVRRILMRQKAYAEGLRAVYLYTGAWQDRIAADEGGADVSPCAHRSTTCCCRSSRASAASGPTRTWRCRCRCSAAPATPRTIRSSSTSGTPRSTPCTRAPPRSRRRTSSSARSSRTRAPRWAWSPARSPRSSPRPARATDDGRHKDEFALLGNGARRRAGHGRLAGRLRDDVRCRTPATLYKVGEHAVSLLMSAGDLLIGYLLLRQATGRAGGAGRRRHRQGRRLLHRQARRRPAGSPATCCPSSPPGGRSSKSADLSPDGRPGVGLLTRSPSRPVPDNAVRIGHSANTTEERRTARTSLEVRAVLRSTVRPTAHRL